MYNSFNKTCMQNIFNKNVSWLNIRIFYFSFFLNFVSKRLIQYWHDQCWNDLLINVNTIHFCNENDRNECENKKKNRKKNEKIWKWKRRLLQFYSNSKISNDKKHLTICMINRLIFQTSFCWKQCELISQTCVVSNFSILNFSKSD